jgi:hypothetical protein
MRWAALFADLEAQLEAEERLELAGEVADRTRRELARLRLADRLRAGAGADVTVGFGPAGTLTGRLRQSGIDWLALDVGSTDGPGALAVLDAVAWVAGLPSHAVEPESWTVVDRRLGFTSVVRGLARDRHRVTAMLRDGGSFDGVVARAGADFFELSELPVAGAHGRGQGGPGRCLSVNALAYLRVG